MMTVIGYEKLREKWSD